MAKKQKSPKKLSAAANQYMHDLQVNLKEGWTAEGQTDQLLFDMTRLMRVFGHYLLEAEPFWETDRLAIAIIYHLWDLPGRAEFGPNDEALKKKAYESAEWVQQTQYKPYGSKPLTTVKTPPARPASKPQKHRKTRVDKQSNRSEIEQSKEVEYDLGWRPRVRSL